MRSVLLIGFVLCAGQAMAQQKPPTAIEQALGAKLVQELQIGVQCTAGQIELRTQLGEVNAQLFRAQARIKELEPKPDPEAETEKPIDPKPER